MPRSGKNNERTEQVPRGRKKSTKIEPLRPQAEHPDKLYNDLAKFPSENPYPILRIHKDGTVLYANKASGELLKARSSGMGQPAPAEWHRLAKEVLASGRIAREEVKDDGRVFAFRVVPITGSDYVNFYGVDITEQKKAEESLKESETRFRGLFDNMSSGVAVYEAVDDGSDFIIRDFNTAGQRMEKTSRENVVGKRVTEVFPGVKEMGLLDVLRRVWQTGKAERHPMTLYKDGRILGWRENNVYKLPSGEIVAVYDDVTVQQAALEQLQKERNLLRTLIDHIPGGIYVKDKNGRFLACNKPLVEFWEARGKDDIIGKTDFDLFEPAMAQHYFDEEQKVIQTGQPIINQESQCTDKSGIANFLLVTKVPLRDSAGNITGLVGIHRDITERKQVEQALKVSEDRFRSLFEQAADAIVVIDARTGEMAEFNDKAHQMLGYTRTEYAKLRLSDIDAIESKEEVAAHIDKIVRQGSDIFEAKQRKKDGTPCDVLVSSKLITVAGKPYLQAIWRDITELKKAEGTLLEYQKQLKQLASQLALTEERERRQIAGEIHDEISQTLAMVKIKLDTLRNSPPSEASAAEIEKISSYVEKVIQETRTLTFELSNPILYELGFEVAVAEWLSEQVQEKHGIATKFQDDGKAKPLDEDVKVMLFRNVRELLTNCIKHAKAETIKVNIRRTNGSIEIVVEDNGVGFDPAQARTTADKKVTFGLFSVRESLGNSGGHFIIESKPGAGCKAIMTAPLKDQSHKKEV